MTRKFANFKRMFTFQLASIKHSAYRWFSSHSSFTLWPAVTYLRYLDLRKLNLRNLSLR